jgi:hypothetical protein
MARLRHLRANKVSVKLIEERMRLAALDNEIRAAEQIVAAYGACAPFYLRRLDELRELRDDLIRVGSAEIPVTRLHWRHAS